MRESIQKRIPLITGIAVFLLCIILIGLNIVKERPAVKRPAVPSSKATPYVEYNEVVKAEPVVRTETLYVLSRANVRKGPGKNHEIIDRLEISYQVEVYKDNNTKWKALTDDKGYIYHTLLGTEKQYDEVYLKDLNAGIKRLKRKGLIIKILKPDEYHHKIYVNYSIWTYQLTTDQQRNIMTNYAGGMSKYIENRYLKFSVRCTIYDNISGKRIITYQLSQNKFY